MEMEKPINLKSTGKRLFRRGAGAVATAALLMTSLTAFADPPVNMAPPIGQDYSSSDYDTGYGNTSQDSVFNWREVPEDQQAPIRRAIFDRGGYQLYDNAGETIVVPFTNNNLYAMKFAVSPTKEMFFVNDGDAPILYVPRNGYLENATVPGSRWYPFTTKFHPTTPVFFGIAPSWDEYIGMGWYHGMNYWGGYYCNEPYYRNSLIIAVPGLFIEIGGRPYYGWNHYHDYYDRHPAPYRPTYYHHDVYRWAERPRDDRRDFRGSSRRVTDPVGRTYGGNHTNRGDRTSNNGGYRGDRSGNNGENRGDRNVSNGGRVFQGGRPGSGSWTNGGSRTTDNGRPVNGDRTSTDGRTSTGGRTFGGGRTFEGGRPTTNGRPPTTGGSSTGDGRTSTGDRTFGGGRTITPGGGAYNSVPTSNSGGTVDSGRGASGGRTFGGGRSSGGDRTFNSDPPTIRSGGSQESSPAPRETPTPAAPTDSGGRETRPSGGGDRSSGGGGGNSGGRGSYSGGDNRSSGGNDRPASSDRSSGGGERASGGGERSSGGGDRGSFGNGGGRGFGGGGRGR
ncbi:MAG: hypothetical protein ABIY70_16820 [Capsulimonas sp.]